MGVADLMPDMPRMNESALDRAAGNWTPSDHAYRTADMRESDFENARF
jgi:hypothetical protein